MRRFRINKYNANKDSLSKNGSALYMTLMFSAILCSRYFVFFPSLIFNVAREGMLYFFPDLWNNENWVFPKLIDSFFAENYS